MRFPILLLCLSAAGCNRNLTPTCAEVGAHVEELFGAKDTYAAELRGVFAKRCQEDQWSAAMRACVGGTKSLVEPKSCKQKLTPEQVKKLEADLAAVDDKEAMKILPGSCTRYEKMLPEVMKCDVLPKDVRDDLQKKFDAFKATWPTVIDKRKLDPICSSAVDTVKHAALACPGATKW